MISKGGLKKPKQIVKTERGFVVNIREVDYRGVLAILIVLAFVASLFTDNTTAQNALGPLAGAAVGWWFNEKRRREAEAD